MLQTFELLAHQRAKEASGSHRATVQLSAADNEEEASNAREIDKVVSEIAGLAGRWGLFRRFLLERLKVRHQPRYIQLDSHFS